MRTPLPNAMMPAMTRAGTRIPKPTPAPMSRAPPETNPQKKAWNAGSVKTLQSLGTHPGHRKPVLAKRPALPTAIHALHRTLSPDKPCHEIIRIAYSQ
jgi:hypothetical protein